MPRLPDCPGCGATLDLHCTNPACDWFHCPACHRFGSVKKFVRPLPQIKPSK